MKLRLYYSRILGTCQITDFNLLCSNIRNKVPHFPSKEQTLNNPYGLLGYGLKMLCRRDRLRSQSRNWCR